MAMEFIAERLPELLLRTREHLVLSGISTGAAALIGVPLGIYIIKKPWLRSIIFGMAGIVQTVPSLAMLAFLLILIGKIGIVPAIIALTLYAFLPIIQNTVTGLEGVPPHLIEASRGMGMTKGQQIKMVRLPLALPVIVAGIKTAAVISVGIATLSAFIGAGGLGEFINRGLSLSDTRLILLGAMPSALLALYVSLAISAIAWGLNERKRKKVKLLAGNSGKYISFIPLIFLFLIGITGYMPQAGTSQSEKTTITIGSKNFTEQLIIAEMMAQIIEIKTGHHVERKLNLGGTMICHEALLKAEIDMYPEYTGTGLLAVLKSEGSFTPGEVYDFVSAEYEKQFNLKWLPPFGFNNTYAFAMRNDHAVKNGWEKVSDLISAAGSLKAGFTAEFAERPDGYPGVKKAYNLSFGKVISLDPALMYDAVKNGQVDIITAFSTDSRIPGYNLFVLEDDKSFFPPYNAAPVVRKELIEKYPEVQNALLLLSGLIDEKTMQGLNFEADQNKREIKEIVQEFLKEKSL